MSQFRALQKWLVIVALLAAAARTTAEELDLVFDTQEEGRDILASALVTDGEGQDDGKMCMLQRGGLRLFNKKRNRGCEMGNHTTSNSKGNSSGTKNIDEAVPGTLLASVSPDSTSEPQILKFRPDHERMEALLQAPTQSPLSATVPSRMPSTLESTQDGFLKEAYEYSAMNMKRKQNKKAEIQSTQDDFFKEAYELSAMNTKGKQNKKAEIHSLGGPAKQVRPSQTPQALLQALQGVQPQVLNQEPQVVPPQVVLPQVYPSHSKFLKEVFDAVRAPKPLDRRAMRLAARARARNY